MEISQEIQKLEFEQLVELLLALNIKDDKDNDLKSYVKKRCDSLREILFGDDPIH